MIPVLPHVTRWFAHLSLARKLTGMSVVTTSASLILACAVFLVYDFSTSRDRLVRDMGMLADVIGRNSTAAIEFGDGKGAAEILKGLTPNGHIVSAVVLARDGTPLARFDREGSKPSGPVPSLPADVVRNGSDWYAFTAGGLALLRPIVFENETIGAVSIVADQEEIKIRAVSLGKIIGAVLLGTFWVALAVAYRLQGVISTPLLRLTDITRVVTHDRRYDVRAEAGGDDEIGELIGGFNKMLDEIQHRDLSLLRNQEDLEQTVEARTAELRGANADMTAHAISGDRERCLAAGMDGYLSKPITQSLLFDVVEQGSAGVAARTVVPIQPVPFNRGELMDRLGGDADLFADVLRLFLDDCPRRVAAIKEAVDLRDAELIRTSAHALKGAAGTLSAAAVFNAAQTLERLGAQGLLEPTGAAWRTLAKEASNLMDTLRQMDAAETAGRRP